MPSRPVMTPGQQVDSPPDPGQPRPLVPPAGSECSFTPVVFIHAGTPGLALPVPVLAPQGAEQVAALPLACMVRLR